LHRRGRLINKKAGSCKSRLLFIVPLGVAFTRAMASVGFLQRWRYE
jgi:hypothetical protein